jgi:putative ABC transport system permease protein
MHALRSLILAAAGSLFGVGLGLLSAIAVLSADDVGRASTASLLSSAGISAGCGFVATGVALFTAGLGAIRRQIHDERAQLASRRPWWRRLWLDVAILVALAYLVRRAERTGAFQGVGGSVYYGQAVSLRLQLVVIPIGVWLGSVLLFARFVGLLLPRLPLPRRRRFGGPVPGLLTRSVRRRSWSAVSAVIMLGLIVALGTSIACFSASYDRAKAADTRYVVGSDLRITPAPTSTLAHPPAYSRTLQVPGIEDATPVVFGLSNALVESETNEDAANLAAVDPVAFARIAPTADGNFVGQSAATAWTALEQHPDGVFVGSELADLLDVEQGDDVSVLVARGTKQQQLTEMPVLGLFERLPGFPEGANLLVNLRRHVQLVPSTNATFFLARTTDAGAGTLQRALDALADGPGSADALQVESRETVLDKDQSSLAALNIRGLLTLDAAYALAMAATAIAVYVFGLLLQRRREYVTLRALGVRTGLVRSLLVAEAGGVAVLGAGAGVVVGLGMAYFLVRVLRPLFILTPAVVTPAGSIALLAGLVLAVSVLASLAATRLVNRLSATELLREE